jgi:hypothetical protein
MPVCYGRIQGEMYARKPRPGSGLSICKATMSGLFGRSYQRFASVWPRHGKRLIDVSHTGGARFI